MFVLCFQVFLAKLELYVNWVTFFLVDMFASVSHAINISYNLSLFFLYNVNLYNIINLNLFLGGKNGEKY